jgi:hypothetical protein
MNSKRKRSAAPKRTSPESRRLEVARAMKVDLEVDLTASQDGPMPPFLREFIETLRRIDEEVHGIAAEDIETVELAFGYSDLMDEFWAGGFIVRLRDGRRAFLGSSYGPGGWKSSDKPTVEMVVADLPRSEFKPEWLPDKRGDAWEENPNGINEFLKSLPRPQTDNLKTIH